MEDKGERSPQTFHVNNFPLPQPRRKQGDRCAYKRVLNTDSGFKLAAWTLENKNDKINISSKLNSVFSTIGKATADKITAKLMGKTHAFAFACMKLIRTSIHAANHVCEISNIFCAFR